MNGDPKTKRGKEELKKVISIVNLNVLIDKSAP
jgi:hypothetical protein